MTWKQRILLHDHLDGSMTLMPILKQLFEMSAKKYPFSGNIREQHAAVVKLFKDPQIDIVEKFSNTTGVMQGKETLAFAAEAYVRIRADQGFEYCEATIAPQYHIYGGLKVQEVVAALIEGIKRGEAVYPKVEVNLLFSVGREVDADSAVSLVNAAGECDRDYVVGIGLVCDEAAHPPEKHTAMFARAKDLGFFTTCHAGEWVSDNPDYKRDFKGLLKNIYTAVYIIKVDRVGHAIPLAYDGKLMKDVISRNINIEGCPGSNLASGLIPNTSYLDIRKLLEAGVLYSLNPDDDLFLPSLDETFALCDAEYKFTEEEKMKLLLNPWETRFGHRKAHTIIG